MPAFNPELRTVAVLSGEGTGVAYLAGALRALDDAGVRIDVLLGKGGGSVVAVLGSIDAGSRLFGKDGLTARLGRGRAWSLHGLYRLARACLALAFTVFVSPLLLGVVALVVFPLLTMARFFAPDLDPGATRFAAWLTDVFSHGEPIYLRAVLAPVLVFLAAAALWWLLELLAKRRWPKPPALLSLEPLESALEAVVWQAVRGADPGDRPKSRKDIGLSYRELLLASVGQPGYRELAFYALDSDSGAEAAFVVLKDRFAKRFRAARGERGAAEPVDLSHADECGVLYDALVASMTPPGLAPPVPIRLPLRSRHGGEVHRFSSSLFVSDSAVDDAVAMGAEQIIYVSASSLSERAGGSAWERLVSSSCRHGLRDDRAHAERHPGIPMFLIRPERERLHAYETRGRSQEGGDVLHVEALVAHGKRDTHRQFVQPLLGLGPDGSEEPEDLVTPGITRWEAGPREL